MVGYLPYSDAVGRLRAVVRDLTGAVATFGQGRRFLRVVDDGTDDLDIPGESYSFRELMDAQADGDLDTLRAHGLTAGRVRVPADDPAEAIGEPRGSLR